MMLPMDGCWYECVEQSEGVIRPFSSCFPGGSIHYKAFYTVHTNSSVDLLTLPWPILRVYYTGCRSSHTRSVRRLLTTNIPYTITLVKRPLVWRHCKHLRRLTTRWYSESNYLILVHRIQKLYAGVGEARGNNRYTACCAVYQPSSRLRQPRRSCDWCRIKQRRLIRVEKPFPVKVLSDQLERAHMSRAVTIQYDVLLQR
ncbi:hypothetical protein BDY19DRAFT_704761 [Irpex rosettiformis]|uniref:Uncharacterized protein n=1 Tax=Irpex rosettiformis TaxID=378272 RepID=A0ACB8TMZ0_9APHY|nr:hypothetical protein BDY19DRAFT_704761 [Irpex rosettiformis]